MGDTDVTVKVPDDRIGAFHVLFGRWRDDAELILVPKEAVAPPPAEPWADDKGSQTAAAAVLTASKAAVIELLTTLADTPGVPVAEDVIATRCGVSAKGAVSHLIATLAATCHKQGRQIPVGWVKTTDGVQYWLTEPTLIWQRALLARRRPPSRPAQQKDVAKPAVRGSAALAEGLKAATEMVAGKQEPAEKPAAAKTPAKRRTTRRKPGAKASSHADDPNPADGSNPE